MTNCVRTVSLAISASLVVVLLLGWTPSSKGSIVLDELRRTVEAHAEYSFTSFGGPDPTEEHAKFAETTEPGVWADGVNASVAFAEASAGQKSYIMHDGSSLLAGGMFAAEGAATPPPNTVALYRANSTMSLTFTVDSTKSFLLAGIF